MNKKGFAVSGMIYAILVLFLILVFSILSILGSRKLTFDKLKKEVLTHLNNDFVNMGANAPELFNNMVPIKYENEKWLVADLYSKWYDYDAKEWANAVVLNPGLTKTVGQEVTEEEVSLWYVWIPRYKYTIFNGNNEGVPEQLITVTFESGTDKTGTVKMIESNQYIKSSTRIILKNKNDNLVENNGTFKIKMLDSEGKVLKSYKNDYLKTDKKGYISMYDSVRWISTFTIKNGKCVLPVVLPDGDYKITKSKFNDCSLKTTDFTVSSNSISGLDGDSQPISNIVLQVRGN